MFNVHRGRIGGACPHANLDLQSLVKLVGLILNLGSISQGPHKKEKKYLSTYIHEIFANHIFEFYICIALAICSNNPSVKRHLAHLNLG